jgi:hypothetical protein
VPVRTILGDSLPTGLYRAVIGADSQLRGGFVAPEIALRSPGGESRDRVARGERQDLTRINDDHDDDADWLRRH